MGKVIPWFAVLVVSVLRPAAKAEPSATQTLVPSLALLELFSPAFKNKGSDSQ